MKVRYGGRGGLGAALVVTAEGARAPEVEMQRGRIIERVNAFYGYRAIARVEIDQSRAGLMQEPERRSSASSRSIDGPAPEPLQVSDVADPALALALGRLGANIRAKAARAPVSPDAKRKGTPHD